MVFTLALAGYALVDAIPWPWRAPPPPPPVAGTIPPANVLDLAPLPESGGGTGPGTVVLTFDDSYRSELAAARVLEARGYRATFYVIAGSLRVDGGYQAYLSPEEVANLSARGEDVESHTLTHPDLTNVSSARLAQELEGSKRALENITGKPVRHLAYPYGDVDARVERAMRGVYLTGRGSDPWYEVAPSDDVLAPGARVDLENLPAVAITANATVAKLEPFLSDARATNGTLVLTFHAFSDAPVDYQWDLADFAKLLDAIAADHLRVRTIAEAFP
jgi:peptidoglycan/xylan/chitin deacetylase (PgdA/CDA1 family)